MEIKEIINRIPEIKEFLTPEEMDTNTFALEKQYPHLVSVKKVGESKEQYPLYCLKIGSGKKKALMYGCPHPNEPIGCMMLEHLSTILCEDENLLKQLDTTFYMIKCVDPDGLHRNQGWLKGPFTYENYVSHFFRPYSDQQVEWTFPFTYKEYQFDQPVPETQAVMKMMEEVKPDFVYTLHNSSFGGVYFYVSHNNKAILDKLPESAHRNKLPLSLGEPECAFSKTYAPAIYEFLQANQYYDYYEETLDGNPCDYMVCGGSSMDYMKNINKDAFVMMCEEPYFYCPDASDLSLCDDMTRKESILIGFEARDKVVVKMRELYDVLAKYADSKTQYMLALSMYVKDDNSSQQAQMALMEAHPEEYAGYATKASRFDALVASKWYSLLAFGMLIGSAKETIKNTNDTTIINELNDMIKACESFIHESCEEINTLLPCQPIPITTLVRVQMESALIVLNEINK